MKKVKILWISGLACNGNAHSFLNYPYLEQFLNDFEFINHPILESKYSLQEIVSETIPCDILLIEGSISPDIKKADKNLIDIIVQYSKVVSKIVTVGTCATFGGIFRESEYEDISGLHFNETKEVDRFKNIKNKTMS
ncbi:MAG: hydrogenase small subunit, partial [Arcobacteraceae bacterium]